MNKKRLVYFGILCSILVFVCFGLYPSQELNVISFIQTKEPYNISVVHNSSQANYLDQKYWYNQCKSFDKNRGDVNIDYMNSYDFFYVINRDDSVNCKQTNISVKDERDIQITNSANVDLTYVIDIDYYNVGSCVTDMVYVPLPAQATSTYGEITVKAGDTYRGSLSYEKVYELRPTNKDSNVFVFTVWSSPRSCPPIYNVTAYKTVVKESNISVKTTLFQNWFFGNNLSKYGCPKPYVVLNDSVCLLELNEGVV